MRVCTAGDSAARFRESRLDPGVEVRDPVDPAVLSSRSRALVEVLPVAEVLVPVLMEFPPGVNLLMVFPVPLGGGRS